MRLYVDAMDVFLVGFKAEGDVLIEQEGWSKPSLQEARAIIYAARNQVDELEELIAILDASMKPGEGR